MLVIIDPSTRHPEAEVCSHIVHQAQRTSRIIRPALPPELRIDTRPEAPPSESLVVSSLQEIDFALIRGVIILGGGASPAQEISWQTELMEWLTHPQGPISRQLPILGVCYGHQLIGTIFGGRVEMLWGEACAKGQREVRLSEPVLGLDTSRSHSLIVSHREGLRAAPAGWRSLCPSSIIRGPSGAQSAHAIEIMRHEEAPWWGFQAHVDATPSFLINNHISSEFPQPYAGTTVIRSFVCKITD